MEILGINLGEALSGSSLAVVAGGSGIILVKAWKIISSKLDPVSYIDKLYSLADTAIENIDNRLIDKITSKDVKIHIQKKIKDILLYRKIKIDMLIKKISD